MRKRSNDVGSYPAWMLYPVLDYGTSGFWHYLYSLFFLNRVSVFIGGGNFLAAIIIILLLLYFIYIDCICISLRNELSKREVEEVIKMYEESKNDRESDHEENDQLFNWPEN